MEDVLNNLIDLFGQLITMGSENPVVLIAGVILIASIVLAIAVLCSSVVLSIPISVVYGIVKLVVWVFHKIHGTRHTRAYYDEYDDYEEEEDVDAPENQPVYPEWMTKKSGRLL